VGEKQSWWARLIEWFDDGQAEMFANAKQILLQRLQPGQRVKVISFALQRW
jgi:hypothetical protein